MKSPEMTILLDGKPMREHPQYGGYFVVVHYKNAELDTHADITEFQAVGTLGVTLTLLQRMVQGANKPMTFPVKELFDTLWPAFQRVLADAGMEMTPVIGTSEVAISRDRRNH